MSAPRSEKLLAAILLGLALGLMLILAPAQASASEQLAGLASFYGSESGSRTASGQRFNPAGMTAAHRSLRFGTRLRVTHRGRSVVVTVNDRGPFIRGRILDLSTGAAAAIGITRAKGLGMITAQVLRCSCRSRFVCSR